MPPCSIWPVGTSATSRHAGGPLPSARRATARPRLDAILDVVPADPRHPYDVRRVVELVADDGDVLEVQPAFGARARHRARAARRGAGGGRGQQPGGEGRRDRPGRGRQGSPLPRRRGTVRAAGAVPRRQPGRPGRDGGRAVGHPAVRRADVRRAGQRPRPEAARDAAQGLRLRLVAHGDEPLRRADDDARVPGRAPRRDAGRERRRRRRHRARRAGAAGARGARRRLRRRRPPELRRRDRPARPARRAARRARRSPAVGAQAGRSLDRAHRRPPGGCRWPPRIRRGGCARAAPRSPRPPRGPRRRASWPGSSTPGASGRRRPWSAPASGRASRR